MTQIFSRSKFQEYFGGGKCGKTPVFRPVRDWEHDSRAGGFYSRFYLEHTFIYKPVTEKMAQLKLYSTRTTSPSC